MPTKTTTNPASAKAAAGKKNKVAKAAAPKVARAPKVAAPKAERMYRTFVGEVTSTSMHKTIVVRVDSIKLNQKYNKKYVTSEKYHVHDEKNSAKVGQTVEFVECRPLSKTKRWRLVKIVK